MIFTIRFVIVVEFVLTSAISYLSTDLLNLIKQDKIESGLSSRSLVIAAITAFSVYYFNLGANKDFQKPKIYSVIHLK